jgi:hypothetical protein
MSRITPAEELNLIEQLISGHPEGIGISELEKALADRYSKPINRRTLQRRLERLRTANRIISDGESIALIYKRASNAAILQENGGASPHKDSDTESYIPISTESRIIRDIVRQPIMQRKPVGYIRSFLETYEPGVAFYLPQSLRDQLHEIGRTPAFQRPAGTYARDILNRLLIDLSWASSRLEGNTYSRLDTQRLIEFGQAAEGKNALETQMILNHKAAIEMLVEETGQVGFNTFTFFNLHAILSENLLLDDGASGRLRRRPVDISGSVFHPIAMPQILEECFHLFLQKTAAIIDPFEQTFFVMVQLPYLQPFEDVNKRVSRIGANIPLFQNNLCPLSFIDVPGRAYADGILGIYELNQVELLRDVFVWAYERSCQRYLAITQNTADPNPLRIRCREALIETVRGIVQGLQAPSKRNVERFAKKLVPEKDRMEFINITLDALQHLHEGRVARYRLKLSEFQAWQRIKSPSRP